MTTSNLINAACLVNLAFPVKAPGVYGSVIGTMLSEVSGEEMYIIHLQNPDANGNYGVCVPDGAVFLLPAKPGKGEPGSKRTYDRSFANLKDALSAWTSSTHKNTGADKNDWRFTVIDGSQLSEVQSFLHERGYTTKLVSKTEMRVNPPVAVAVSVENDKAPTNTAPAETDSEETAADSELPMNIRQEESRDILEDLAEENGWEIDTHSSSDTVYVELVDDDVTIEVVIVESGDIEAKNEDEHDDDQQDFYLEVVEKFYEILEGLGFESTRSNPFGCVLRNLTQSQNQLRYYQ
jgi:hypothetical protein